MAPRPHSSDGGKRLHSRKGAKVAASTPSSQSVLAEARKLKQQAERKLEGPSRDPALKRSAELFETAISLPLSISEQEEALFDLGDVLLLSSGSVQAGVFTLTGSPFAGKVTKPKALEIQLQSFAAAIEFCRKSFQTFERVSSMKGVFEMEAMVNSGNALCDWAELALEIPSEHGGGPAVAKELFDRAHERYCSARLNSPEDVELLTNIGDCYVQRAELVASHQSAWPEAKELYEGGLGAYVIACSNADARMGDDLAGLLQNWGSGLLSVAERTPDPEEAWRFARSGREKFNSSIKFRPTDTSLHIGLGEGLVGFVDKFLGKTEYAQETMEIIKSACEEGFGVALRIDAKNVSALLGLGDAHLSAAKIMANLSAEVHVAKHLGESMKSYLSAFQFLKNDYENKSKISYEEQCDALYNFACAAALAGNEMESFESLRQLHAVDALCGKDLVEDTDLVSLQKKDWFIAIASTAASCTENTAK